MQAPAEDDGRNVLQKAVLPVDVVGESFTMREPIPPREVTERITQIVVARRDETQQGAANRGTSYERPLPPMEGEKAMSNDHKKDDHGAKAHGDNFGNTALKVAGAVAVLAFVWAVFLAPSNKSSGLGGQPSVVYVTPAPAVVAAPVVYPTRPTPSVQFAQPQQRNYRTRTRTFAAPCDRGDFRGSDGRCHHVTVTWHPGNPLRR